MIKIHENVHYSQLKVDIVMATIYNVSQTEQSPKIFNAIKTRK